jgi:hypothetical protein
MLRFLSRVLLFLAFPPPPPLLLSSYLPCWLATYALLDMVHSDLLLFLLHHTMPSHMSLIKCFTGLTDAQTLTHLAPSQRLLSTAEPVLTQHLMDCGRSVCSCC